MLHTQPLFSYVLVFMFPQEAVSNLTQKFCAISEENSLLLSCVLCQYFSSSTKDIVNQVIFHWMGPGMEEQNITHFYDSSHWSQQHPLLCHTIKNCILGLEK